jgi:predicted transporter
MDMMSVLWQVGIFASVLVFGVKIGLASGLANLSKKLFAIICIAYGGGVVLISAIASLYADQLIQAIYGYNTIFYIIMASIMIIAGLFTIREWKIHDKNTSTATSLAIIAPCPCCFGSIIVSIMLVAPTVGLGLMHLSVIVAAALVLTILVTYYASNYLIKFIKKPYPIVLGNFMFFLGIYFLLSALFLPNITAMIQNPMEAISIASPYSLIGALILVLVVVAIGGVISRRNSNFN